MLLWLFQEEEPFPGATLLSLCISGQAYGHGHLGVAAPSLQSCWVPLEVFHKAWLVYVPSVPYNLGFMYIKVCVCVEVHCMFILHVHIYVHTQTAFMHLNRRILISCVTCVANVYKE